MAHFLKKSNEIEKFVLFCFFKKKTGIFANSPFSARKSNNIDMTNMARMETAKSYNVNNLFFIRENTNIYTHYGERESCPESK